MERAPHWLIAVGAYDFPQPFLHDLAQVISRPAELGIAAGDISLLLALQLAGVIEAPGFTHDPDIHRMDLAVEVGQLAIGADRLLHRAAGGLAIETRLA